MKNTRELPDVNKLNEIQREWMALNSSASEQEKKRVFKLMEDLPRDYVSATSDLKTGTPMIGGSPIWISGREISAAIAALGRPDAWRNVRTDVVWVGSDGKWVSI